MMKYTQLSKSLEPENFKKILEIMPEPSSVVLETENHVNCRHLIEHISDVEAVSSDFFEFNLENPTKEKIMDIYSRQRFQNKKTHIKRISWHSLHPDSSVTVTPESIHVKFLEQKPDYISQLIKLL